ncbi:MAG: glycosyltransferase family 4 protein [Pseudomonadota bacterium]|nr:glycosyltransferase family 4 protein [Pseudomonadota bacterium]
MAETVLISINASWNIINFRTGLVSALRDRGYRVVVVAPEDDHSAEVRALGVDYIPLEMDKKGLSPARDLLLLARYYRLLRAVKPDVFLGYTPKPNIYGSIACHLLGVPVINNVAGLGTAFIKEGWLARLLTFLYSVAFRRSRTIFFQNRDDLDLFLSGRVVQRHQARLLPGSGIDLNRFRSSASPQQAGRGFRFLLVARLLWDKGIGEYVEAARRLRDEAPEVRCQLLGFADAENRTAIPRTQLQNWMEEGVVDYLGHASDVRPFIAAADCIVLPSYREGLPRVLLEAAAMAKPLIATDVPGCRHLVQDGKNGFLCTVRDANSLAEAMLKMAALPADERQRMGAFARSNVEEEFDERIVIDRYLLAVREALGREPGQP